MKIFAAGIETETNTFSPIPTGLGDFNVTCSENLNDQAHLLPEVAPFKQWQRKARDRKDQLLFGLYAWAHPAGLTTKSTYENLRDQLLSLLQANGQVDIVLLNLHGAMMAQGFDDCEGDLLKRIRQLLGPNVIIAAELDLHCHLTQKMVENVDILITFKEYPHVDVAARGDELFDLAIQARLGHCRPVMAVFDCRMMGMYPTSTPVMRGFIDAMVEAEQQEGVLSISFCHGFPFGDMPEAGGKILVITDNNKALAEQLAKELGLHIFGLRHEIGFDTLSLERALSKTVENSNTENGFKNPVVVADQSDNAGGGAPSDSTFALRWLIDNHVDNAACAIFYDPQVVKLAIAAGIGAELKVRLGGKLGVTSGDPLDLVVTVSAIKKNYLHRFPQEDGEASLMPIADTVALHCLSSSRSGIDIVVSSERCQCYCPSIFDDLGIPSREKKLLVIKSMQHFYGAFAPIASEVIYMAGPGAVPPTMQQIPYQRMCTEDKYPWVDNPFAITTKNSEGP